MKTIGIIYKSIDYKETSKIVYLYTPYGKVSIKALGANNPKKGLYGFTTTGNIVSFVSTDSSFPSLLEYHLEESIFDLTTSIDKMKVFEVILDIINNLPDDINHIKTFDYIKKTILDLKNSYPNKLLSIFLIKMLYTFGVTPNIKDCINCGSKDIIYFDNLLGGALCRCCSIKNNIEELNIWKEYYYDKKEINEYSDCDFNSLLIKIKDYYYTHTHIKLSK